MCCVNTRGFCFSDSLNPFFETVWNIGSLIIRLLISIKAVWNIRSLKFLIHALGNLIYCQLPNGENQYYQYDLENQLVRAEIKKPTGNTNPDSYTDPDSYEPLAQIFTTPKTEYLAYFHNDQIGIPPSKELIHG